MKTYTLQFGGGDPRTFTGLAPTMLIFYNLATSATIAPPSISESPAPWGVYSFQYGTTQPIWFLADAATTSPGPAGRYVVGVLDPSDRIDEYGTTIVAIGTTNVALGTTNVALGTTNIAIGTTIYALEQSIGNSLATTFSGIGSTASLIGDSATDPVTLFGYMKRANELLTGNQQFIKSTGVLTQYDRTGATTLSSKTIANSSSLVTKT